MLGIWGSTCLPLHSDQLVSTCQRQNSISITCLHPASHPSCGSPLSKRSSNSSPPPAPASSSGALPSLLGVHFAILRVGRARFIMAGDRCRKHCSCPLAGITPTAAAKTTSPRASIGTLSLPNGSVSKTTCPVVSQNGSPWSLDGEHPGVRTSVADRLPLLVNQEQDEGQAEDAHDAGACCQCSGRDICNSRAPE